MLRCSWAASSSSPASPRSCCCTPATRGLRSACCPSSSRGWRRAVTRSTASSGSSSPASSSRCSCSRRPSSTSPAAARPTEPSHSSREGPPLPAGSGGPVTYWSGHPSGARGERARRGGKGGPSSVARGGAGVVVGRRHPAHQAAQLAAGLLDGVRLGGGPLGLEVRRTGVLVGDEGGRPRAVLDGREDVLHRRLDPLVDDLRPGGVVAVLGGVRHRPALLGDAALVHEVDDQL